MIAVKTLRRNSPDVSPISKASTLTSQIPSNNDEMLGANKIAEFQAVVNIAYDAPTIVKPRELGTTSLRVR